MTLGPFLTQKPKLRLSLDRIKRPFELMTDQELIAAQGKTMVFDVECYPNYFLASFKEIESGKVVCFEYPFDIRKLMWVLRSFLLIGFNSRYYDIILLWLACCGFSPEMLKACSDDIIKYGLKKEDLEKKYNFYVFECNHIDLIEVAPLDGSLKLYAGRLHAPRLQELPFDADKLLTPEEAETVKYYNINDLDCTALLYKELSPQIKLREELGQIYDQDLRSKSDAQIAEYVIRSEVQKLTGTHIRRPQIAPGTSYKYKAPAYIVYRTDPLKMVLQSVREANFVVNEKGSIEMPRELDGLEIKIGQTLYRFGIGGLHSQEKCVSHKADAHVLLLDRDVSSYYPAILLNSGLYARHIGPVFLDVYKSLVDRRLEAKRTKNMVVADSLKITINGTFGKHANKYSCLYSPDVMVTITLTGQLALLVLIERIELAGISVVSGNTDGVLIKCHKTRYDDLEQIIAQWEHDTGFITEETKYKAFYLRDVNNFIGVKEDDECKTKGAYSEKGSSGNTVLSKNPVNLICNDAVKAIITEGKAVEETIIGCKDIRRFVTVRRVKGGAEKDNVYLGKVVRWYYAKNEIGTINYVSSGNIVPRSEGAKPLMDLPESLPFDLDFNWYICEAESILKEIAFYESSQKAKQLKFF